MLPSCVFHRWLRISSSHSSKQHTSKPAQVITAQNRVPHAAERGKEQLDRQRAENEELRNMMTMLTQRLDDIVAQQTTASAQAPTPAAVPKNKLQPIDKKTKARCLWEDTTKIATSQEDLKDYLDARDERWRQLIEQK